MKEELAFSFKKQSEYETARKELIATISHELRTPISSIKMYAEGLKEGLAEDFETFSKYIEIINKKADSLNQLIDDLFLHSQQDLSQLKIIKIDCYSRKLITQILEPIKEQFKKEFIQFEDAVEFSDFLICVDQTRIEQVVLNLVFNARKHIKNGGLIRFEAKVGDNFLKIIISDNGKGIKPEDMPFIFDRFYQGETSKEGDYQGAGLGLSICKYIIEQHGGNIYVESSLNVGSRFTFTLPK